MSILAIDQSYTSSGVVVLTDEGELETFHLHSSDSEQDPFYRAWHIAQHIVTVATENQVRFVALEGLAYAKAGDSTRDLAGLQFVITCMLRYVHGYHVEIIYPTTIKKFATGRGNCKKEEMIDFLPQDVKDRFDQYGVKKTTGLLDLSDAYWLGRVANEAKPKDFNSQAADEQHTIERAIKQIEQKTGLPARINEQTFAPEVWMNDQWVEITIAE